MASYSFTEYFEDEVLPKRPYPTREMCIRVLKHPLKVEIQADGRIRFWAILDELGGRPLRVVTLSDRRVVGDIVGIELENASGKLDLEELTFKLPVQSRRRSA